MHHCWHFTFLYGIVAGMAPNVTCIQAQLFAALVKWQSNQQVDCKFIRCESFFEKGSSKPLMAAVTLADAFTQHNACELPVR